MLQVLQCFHSAKIAVLRPGWKARTDQKARSRNSCYTHDRNIANKYRKDAVNFVISPAFFVYVITLIINRQCNLKPKERLIYLFKTIHYEVAYLTAVLQEA